VLEDHRGPGNQLGLALQLCTLPWLGFVPDELTAAPAAAVGRLADQLATGPGALAGYGGWNNRTRTEQLRRVLARLGWSTARAGAVKVLDDFLLARALDVVTGRLTLAALRSVAHTHVVTYPVIVLVAAAGAWLSLGALTVAGLRRRGSATPVRAVATLLAFPATWTVWYLVDRRTLGRRATR